MLDGSYLGPWRQQLIEMAAPTGGILAVTPASRLGIIQDALDASAQPGCRFRLSCPDRFKDIQHESDIDSLYRQIADDWIGIRCQRGAPLRRVLLVAPTGTLGSDALVGALLERDGLGRFEPCRGTYCVALGEWVLTLNLDQTPQRVGLLACISERHDRIGTDAHEALPAVQRVAEQPRALALAIGSQIQAAAVVVHSFALGEPFHLNCGKASYRLAHELPSKSNSLEIEL